MLAAAKTDPSTEDIRAACARSPVRTRRPHSGPATSDFSRPKASRASPGCASIPRSCAPRRRCATATSFRSRSSKGEFFAVVWRRGTIAAQKRTVDEVAAPIREILWRGAREGGGSTSSSPDLRAANVHDLHEDLLDNVDALGHPRRRIPQRPDASVSGDGRDRRAPRSPRRARRAACSALRRARRRRRRPAPRRRRSARAGCRAPRRRGTSAAAVPAPCTRSCSALLGSRTPSDAACARSSPTMSWTRARAPVEPARLVDRRDERFGRIGEDVRLLALGAQLGARARARCTGRARRAAPTPRAPRRSPARCASGSACPRRRPPCAATSISLTQRPSTASPRNSSRWLFGTSDLVGEARVRQRLVEAGDRSRPDEALDLRPEHGPGSGEAFDLAHPRRSSVASAASRSSCVMPPASCVDQATRARPQPSSTSG